MKNLCGKCNVCCTAYRIDKKEIFWKDGDKAARETCEKLVDGKCSIYNKRPHTCAKFECWWLQLSKLIADFSEEFRPDNLKLVVSTYYYEDTDKFAFKIKELEKGRLNFDNMDPILNRFLQVLFGVLNQQKGEGQVIIYRFGEKKGHPLKQNIGG